MKDMKIISNTAGIVIVRVIKSQFLMLSRP